MNIKTIKITERASYNYQVSEWTYEIELEPTEDPTEATSYIRNLAISNATADVKVLVNNLPNNNNSVGNVGQQPRQGYNNAPKQQYRPSPYNQQINRQPAKSSSEAQKAFYRQLAEQLGYDPNTCPENSQEAAKAIKSMKSELGLD